MSYTTDFDGALRSIRQEIEGKGASKLKGETGHTFQEWRSYIHAFFAAMWPPSETFGDPRYNVVQDYVIASAVLEWAAINIGDAMDLGKHKDVGPQFDKPAGKGASIGPFQGYAAQSYKALRDNAALRTMIKKMGIFPPSARSALDTVAIRAESRVGTPNDGIYGHGRVPGSSGSRAQTDDLDKKLRTALSSYDTLKDPFVSLIGKLQLSVDYAEATMMNHDMGSMTQISHMWRLPDPVLRYVLLAYEVSGGDEDWLSKVANIIWKADEAAGMSKTPSNPGAVLNFEWRNGSRVGYVYNMLGMDWHHHCTYGQLVNIW